MIYSVYQGAGIDFAEMFWSTGSSFLSAF